MRIRKYYAPNPQDAFKQIKAELGVEAMILNSQKVRQGGWLGFLKGPIYEVTVAIESPGNGAVPSNSGETVKPIAPATKSRPSSAPEMASELEEIRTSIKQLQETVSQLNDNHNGKTGAKRSPQLVRLRDLLISQGLDEQATNDIMKQIDFELSRKAMQDWAIVREAAARQLEQRFTTIDVIDESVEGGPTIIFVVGPTGVGKTTTIAKLAAMFAADKTRSVSLVTMDTVRIGAIPQLQAYADILGISLEVVYSPTELSRSADTRSPLDIILVDTPGWSPKGPARAKIPEFVNAVEQPTVLLAISSTTKDSDAVRAVKEMDGIPVQALMITKLDETSFYGSAFNLVHQSQLPVAYITTGQNVPEDIEEADSRKMALRLLGVEK